MSLNVYFAPDATGVANGNYFGFPFSIEQSALCLLSVPWDVTVSYRAGSAAAPDAIIEASTQVEIFDAAFAPDLWQSGIATLEINEQIRTKGQQMRQRAERIIAHIENGGSEDDMCVANDLKAVNQACEWLVEQVCAESSAQMDAGRKVGLVGGDHSTPLGLIRALAARHDSFGVLHVDAHCDLRQAYEGFEFSHASIMYNTLKLSQIERLVQVAVRDYSLGEAQLAAEDDRVVQFSDRTLSDNEFNGMTWAEQCREIVSHLPQKVYVSFDIDGLQRDLCPSTGTPVPGGLSWAKAVYLLEELMRQKRQVIGFDLNEVAPSDSDEWDAIVGARLLYKLALLTLHC